ncbi:carboxypeptidase-like regulatory domain-containing protein [Roseimicrobium sp. ORNL1]|uniref:carboxypeptidase-like regulatory domain-containing protein n=1 Tax=Roseimicrobium sp. ORNL1 TaxID=2711231 RepID=UPI0013E1E503|nr:carboxypeptidase-like regulatory domain-containing protein [Roseimicrobium sp. ORNL1]QIF05572.1 carboxypeptidase regulatory-like domain-containing protein [Roseimicrobium sp. ORNL1]
MSINPNRPSIDAAASRSRKRMKQRVVMAVLAVLLLAGGVFWFGVRVPKPRLFKSTVYPPKTADEKAMWEWWNYMQKVDRSFEWKTPIEFYGKVVDQNHAPVDGARVDLSWSPLGGRPNESKLTTGADGSFLFSGVQGKGLTVTVYKEDHVGQPKSRASFEYAAFFEPHFHLPDPADPVVFQLWKLIAPEPMYLWALASDLTVDGKPHPFNVKMGQAGGGDLIFTVTRTNQTKPGTFDYTLTVQAGSGGGIAETKDDPMFTAPDDGYVPSITIAQKSGPPDYLGVQKLRFYLRTPDNKYAAITAQVAQHNGPSAQVQMEIYFNPSGSRNLEYDYKKRINERTASIR